MSRFELIIRLSAVALTLITSFPIAAVSANPDNRLFYQTEQSFGSSTGAIQGAATPTETPIYPLATISIPALTGTAWVSSTEITTPTETVFLPLITKSASTSPVDVSSHLLISKTAPAIASVGAPITYTLRITNIGTAPAANLVITDAIPTGANYVSGGTLGVNQVVSWTLPSLAGGATTQASFVVTAATTITNSNYRVAASGGISATGTIPMVTVILPPPEANFTTDAQSGPVPLTVTFTNHSTHATSYLWHFGDGITSTLTSPTHTYTQSGIYTVTLYATGLAGTSTATTVVRVNDQIITGLSVINDSPTLLNQAATLTVTVTAGSNVVYTWDFGDGSQAAGPDLVVTHTYPTVGIYTAVVTASNSASAVTATTTLSITGKAVLAISKSAPISVAAGEPITYTLLVTNNGTLTATRLLLTDTLPAGATYIEGGTQVGNIVSWTLDSLPPGSHTTAQFAVQAAETITNSDYRVAADDGVAAVGQEPIVTLVYPLVSVDFVANPLAGTMPLTVTFINSSTNALIYLWDFGDGITSTEVSPAHLYTQVGVYSVTLTSTGLSGSQTLIRPNYLTVDEPVLAEFVAAPFTGTLPLTVSFTNHSTGATHYLWDFGDGITDTAVNPTHTYTQAGIYTVTLSANGVGGSDTVTQTNYITVSEPLIAVFAATPLTGTVPLTVTFTNSSTGAISYLWDFGDGITSTFVNPTHIYTQPGVYSVILNVQDEQTAATLTLTDYITAYARIVPDFVASPLTGTAPLTVTFTNSSTNATEFLWDFGDGVTLINSRPITTPVISLTHTYTRAGIYTVSLAASNSILTEPLTRTRYITINAPIIREWRLITTSASPPIIGEHSLAYDGVRNRVILYGGNTSGWPYQAETWEFDGTEWFTITTSTQPVARYGAGLAYNPVRQVTVLFGGSNEMDTALNQTWEYINPNWTQVPITGTIPASRTYASMLTNPTTGIIYLFGGNNSETYFNDLWKYDNHAWTEIKVNDTRPVSRTLAAMAFDTEYNRLLLFGGRSITGTPLADLWAFDLITETWQELDAGDPNGPSPRMAHALVYDPTTHNLVLVGGVTDQGDTRLGDLWHYQTECGWTEITSTTVSPRPTYQQAVYGDNAIILFSNGEIWRYE